MTLKLGFQIATGLVLVTIAVRESVQLAQHRHDGPLRVLVPGLWSLAIGATAGIPDPALLPVANLLGRAVFTNTLNALNIVMAYCFAAFFLLASDSESDNGRRIARRELWIAAAGVIALVVIWNLAPWDRIPTSYTEYRQHLGRFVYCLIFDWWNIGFWLLGAYRGLRYLGQVTQPWARLGVLLVTIGALVGGLALFTAALAIDLLHFLWPGAPTRFVGLDQLYITALVAGQTLLAAGFAFPSLAEVLIPLRHRVQVTRERRHAKNIAALWRLLAAELPFVVLSEPTRVDTASPTELDTDQPAIPSLDRQVEDCVDALGWLGPYYLAGGLHPERYPDGVTRTPWAAKIVHAALLARAADAEAEALATEPPFPRFVPDITRWRTMVRWLSGLGSELDRLDTPAQLQQQRANARGQRSARTTDDDQRDQKPVS